MRRLNPLSLILPVLFSVPQGTAAQATRVQVTPSESEIHVEGTVQLRASAYDENGRQLDDADFRWVSPGDLVTVDQTGLVTGVLPGEAVVAAVVEGVPGITSVRVLQPPADRLIVAERIDIRVGTGRTLDVSGLNRFDEVVPVDPEFSSSAPDIVSVDRAGRVVAAAEGEATVRVRSGDIEAATVVRGVANPAVEYELSPPGADVRTGDVVRLSIDARDDGGASVGGFDPQWSISGSGASIAPEGEEGAFVAEQPGTYVVTAAVGPAASRSVVIRAEPRVHESRLVRVGRGPAPTHRSGDTWVFEGVDGRDYAYIGTFYHDWMKVWDVTDPSQPQLTDSLQLDARRINDIKIHPDNRLAVVTREGASSRRNGIVILDLSDPAHPTILSEYTDTVTGGVHNVWILDGPEVVYAVHNGTSDLHIIDISDPSNPSEVGRWGLDKSGKSLHDVIVQDGYAYLSYWDDGLVTLDAGAGSHGGTPHEPVFVNQLKYPQGNTHTAWRHGKYLFVGDEIYPSDWDPEALGPIEARGYVHVLDMTDMDRPVEVARYEVPEAGAHNLWSDDRDRLYIGYYQAGLRVVDVSGELRGDLYRQGREIASLKTSATDAAVPNWSMTWGAQLFKGNIYTSDLHSGLWIARLVEGELVP